MAADGTTGDRDHDTGPDCCHRLPPFIRAVRPRSSFKTLKPRLQPFLHLFPLQIPSHLTMNSLPDRNHQFLFSLLNFKSADSARKITIRRVYDVCMHSLCLGDVRRARKAFGILLRCREFDWKASWSLAIYMLNAHDPERDDSFFLSQVERLRSLMLQDPSLVSRRHRSMFRLN